MPPITDTVQKRHYRNEVYGFISQHCDLPPAHRCVVYLEGPHAFETVDLLNRGYAAHNLHPCTGPCPGVTVASARAFMAHITRRVRALGVNTKKHCMKISRLVLRLRRIAPRPHVVHLDFCGHLQLDEVKQTINNAFDTTGIVIINILRGRKPGENDASRLKQMRQSIQDAGFRIDVEHWDQYANGSGTQTHLWLAAKITRI
jgi:hypothetical protein